MYLTFNHGKLKTLITPFLAGRQGSIRWRWHWLASASRERSGTLWFCWWTAYSWLPRASWHVGIKISGNIWHVCYFISACRCLLKWWFDFWSEIDFLYIVTSCVGLILFNFIQAGLTVGGYTPEISFLIRYIMFTEQINFKVRYHGKIVCTNFLVYR